MSIPPPQNIYDDPTFLAGYARLSRFGPGWQHAFEWPSFQALLPEVQGSRVLDLGCGMGQLAHYLAEQGASEVIGVDLSARMLALAQDGWAHPRVTFRRGSGRMPPRRPGGRRRTAVGRLGQAPLPS